MTRVGDYNIISSFDILDEEFLSAFLIDFYKAGHIDQYPKNVTKVFSNWTPRTSRVESRQGMFKFGDGYFCKEYLIRHFQKHFFSLPIKTVITRYKEVIGQTLGIEDPRVDHIIALHREGHLPVKIYALPEGTFVPVGVPSLVITNTKDEFFWVPNYLETLMSNILWMAGTSATTASVYREIFTKAAKRFGEKDLSFVNWMGHDFSMRGLPGIEAALLSGMGHLLSFSGTDTLPAIIAGNVYYKAPLTIGGSVPATEHSVMCAGEKDGEFETFRRLILEVYPTGIVSIVSDTWDLWQVLTDFLPRLKNEILARKGKVVIRPDSGDPVLILCGDPNAPIGSPQNLGVFRLLEQTFGTDGNGHLNNVGAIYGDSITPVRAQQIMDRLVDELHLSPYNVVLGIGSYTYQYVTRDTYGQAMKATCIETVGIDGTGRVIPIFKDPVTDDGGKRSHKGIPCVYVNPNATSYQNGLLVVCTTDPTELDKCEFRLIFDDGKFYEYEDFLDIRARVQNTIDGAC